jgi:methylmalonyl-CoA/ethylmalonyl-CoA epimerase
MPNVHIDHISMCVHDLEQAIADWEELLTVLSPGHAAHMTRGRGADVIDGTPMVWATFQNPDPQGVSIQLWAAGAEGTWVDKVLAKRGEFVHHIAFLSNNFGHTVQQCKDAGLPVVYDDSSNPDTMPWLKWNFIPESKTHGVLIELATRYQAVDGVWLPHPGNAENTDLRDELRDRFAAS